MNDNFVLVVFRWLISALSTAGVYLFGGGNDWIYALITFIVIDYITGLLVAAYNKTLSSKIGYKGLIRKIGILCIIAVAHIIDTAMDLKGVICTVIICFFCANEGLSILENCAKLGLPIPQKLIDLLEQVKENSESKKGSDSNGQNKNSD